MDNRATAWVGKLLADQQKKIAAEHALNFIQPGTTIGIGTGSTADHFTRALGRKVAEGMEIVGVPTSVKTAELARACGIPLTTLDQVPRLSVTVDGADEVGPGLVLIKGAGGALLREKIVANASDRMIVIADASKDVAELGAFPLPIEVSSFGLRATIDAIERAIGEIGMPAELRMRKSAEQQNYVTDGGNWIIDASFGRIVSPKKLSDTLSQIPGVVEHGLFIGIASRAIFGTKDGIEMKVAAPAEEGMNS